ncbi:MAG TPA: hypothetical protein VMH78_02065 [Thermoplasmata archaeon]|nr:hypothetical protein [Thermoplasmata archaeon]
MRPSSSGVPNASWSTSAATTQIRPIESRIVPSRSKTTTPRGTVRGAGGGEVSGSRATSVYCEIDGTIGSGADARSVFAGGADASRAGSRRRRGILRPSRPGG